MKPQYKFEVCISYGKDDVKYIFELVPWYLKPLRLVNDFIPMGSFEGLYVLHNNISGFIHRRTKRFEINTNPENVRKFQEWAGWEIWPYEDTE